MHRYASIKYTGKKFIQQKLIFIFLVSNFLSEISEETIIDCKKQVIMLNNIQKLLILYL